MVQGWIGGAQSQTKPFDWTGAGATLDYTSSMPTGTRVVEIADGQSMAIALDGSFQR